MKQDNVNHELFSLFKPSKSMFQPGRKSKQIFIFLFLNYIQIFKKMIEEDFFRKQSFIIPGARVEGIFEEL